MLEPRTHEGTGDSQPLRKRKQRIRRPIVAADACVKHAARAAVICTDVVRLDVGVTVTAHGEDNTPAIRIDALGLVFAEVKKSGAGIAEHYI